MILCMISFKPEDRLTTLEVCQKLIISKQFSMEGIEVNNVRSFNLLINIKKW